MKLLIVDPINTGFSHSYFNRTFIEALYKIESTTDLHVLLEKDHYQESVIKEFVDNAKITKKIFSTPKNANSLNRSVAVFKLLNLVYKVIKKNDINILVILSADNLLVPVFMLIINFLNKKIKVIVVLHNNLVGVERSSFRKNVWKLALRKSHGILLSKYLGEHSKRLLGDNIHVVDHPTYQHINNSQSIKEKSKSYKYDFLILGRHSELFGDNKFTDDFLLTCSKYKNKNINIAIGSNSRKLKIPEGISISVYDFPISSEKYQSLINESKFIIFPPESGSRLTASGVHLDAITAAVPVIAPRVGVFYENVPTSCKKLLYENSDIKTCVVSALKLDDSDFDDLVNDIKLLSSKFNLKETTSKLDCLLQNING